MQVIETLFYQLDLALEPMKCGASVLTALPTILFLSGTILLLHQLITNSGRTLFWRRTNRDLILQEVLLIWLFGQSLKLWWTLVHLTNIFSFWLWAQMIIMYPKSSYYNILSNSRAAPDVPEPILFLLDPSTTKNIILLLISSLPLIVTHNISQRNNLSQFMFWIGGNRINRSEMGSAGYYLERPVPILPTETSSGPLFRNSDPSFKSISLLNSAKNKQRSKSI